LTGVAGGIKNAIAACNGVSGSERVVQQQEQPLPVWGVCGIAFERKLALVGMAQV